MNMSTVARTFILILGYLMMFPIVAGAGWETGKAHWPRLIYESSDLPRIQARVRSAQEPYRTLWERIQGRGRNEPRHGTNDWGVECENGNIAKDAAFVYAMTGDTANAQRAWNALLKMKCDAKWWDSKDVNASIRMAQSLTAHCQAYDILRGAGYCPSTSHGKVRENLANLADDLYAIGKNSIYWLKTNYQLKITSAVGIAAITLNTASRADEWINWAMTKFWQVFQHLTTPEGGYAEGPSYLLYSAVNYLPFMRAYNLFMDGKGGYYKGGGGPYWIPNFLSDNRVKAVHDWGVAIRMPNGTRPGFDDSYYIPFVGGLLASSTDTSGHDTDHVPGTSTDHYAWDWYSYETLPQTSRQHFFSDYNVDLSVDVLCAFDADGRRMPPGWKPTRILPDAGTAVFRDHWGKGATYMLLLGENGDMIATTTDPLGSPQESHEHPDNTGIVIYARGDLLALDSGYANWDERGRTKNPKNHSIVTIEGDLSFYGFTYSDGFIDYSFDTDYMDFGEIKTYIKTGYNKGGWLHHSYVDYRRSVLFPNHRYFVVIDALNPVQWGISRRYHDYHWRLHGNGLVGKDPASLEGSYTHLDGQGGVWTREHGKLLAFVTTDRGSPEISHEPDFHALTWKRTSDPFQSHEVLLARKEIESNNSSYDVRFLSILYPTGASSPLPTLSPLSIHGAAAVKVEESQEEGGMVGIAMTKEGWNDVTIPSRDTGVSQIETNARVLFTQVDPLSQRVNQVFAKNASYVNYDGNALFSAGDWIYHLGLGFGQSRISGYLIFTDRAKPSLDIYTGWERSLVRGPTVSRWESLGGGVIRIWLSDQGEFAIYNEDVMPAVENPGFSEALNYWEPYGDGGNYTSALDGGDLCAAIERDGATGEYLGLVQRKIPCHPNTTYRLTLWVKTDTSSGSVAAGLGNWGSPNTHEDFGWTGGQTDWTQISGTWTSGQGENSLDIVLYGTKDFSGRGYFDELVLEKVGPVPLEVSIRGPSHLGYKELGTYAADVFRGSGDYRYQWYKKMEGSDHWYPLGTGQAQGQSMLNRGFTLKVDVRDALTGAEGSATKHVEYGGDEEVRRVKEISPVHVSNTVQGAGGNL
jgi:hypothetical protein